MNNLSPFEPKNSIQRIGLKKYPKDEIYCIFELPVRVNHKGDYQVWTGKKWYKLEINAKNRINTNNYGK